MMEVFEQLESKVRSYCRSFPTVFTRAQGHQLWDESGSTFIDFFSGAGALNYGHNHPVLKQALLEYLASDGITHGLDMATEAKREFLETFESRILAPRQMTYKLMFTGPTGTNAVEAALKLARTLTGRTNVVAFTNAFHGMTLGSLALTGNSGKREGAGVPLTDVTRMPFNNYMGHGLDTIDLLEQHLENSSSGVDLPAAVILETIQAEGGINVAGQVWLRRLHRLLQRFDILLIIDDIQVGCGRTGRFFSFETAGIQPDIVCLSKSLSGYGLPFAINLVRPELDQWEPGKHNGTFRGNNLAFVTATTTLNHFWADSELSRGVQHRETVVRDHLQELADTFGGDVRGRGLIQGWELEDKSAAARISRTAFEAGLIIETSGPQDEVLKVLPPLNISEEALRDGLELLTQSVEQALPALASR